MKAQSPLVALVASLVGLGACGGDSGGPSSPGVKILVAPLNLPGVLGTEYALAVFNLNPFPAVGIFNADGSVQTSRLPILVWQQPSVTSNQYGSGPGGDIAFPGPCDASAGDLNFAAVALKQIDVGSGNGSNDGIGPFAGSDNVLDDQNTAIDLDPDFANPAPYNEPLVLAFACVENTDTPVVFNLTIFRDADQGFFDIAVKFEDVFCSMKIDSCYGNNVPIKLLFDEDDPDANGSQVDTVVLAAACSAGTDDADTEMWMAELGIACDDGVSFNIDPTGGASDSTPGIAGNHCVTVQTSWALPLLPAVGTISYPDQIKHLIFQVGTRFSHAALPFTAYEVTSTSSSPIPVRAVVAGSGGNQPAPGVTPGGWSVFGFYSEDGGASFFSINGSFGAAIGIFSGGQDASGADEFDDVCYALFWGEEDLLCDGVPCNKEYWNIAINSDDLKDANLTNCRLTTAITAASTNDLQPFVDGQLADPAQTYPYVGFDAKLTLPDGNVTCFTGPMGSSPEAQILFGSGSNVIDRDPFPQLCYYFTQGDASPRPLDLPVCP